MRNGALELNVDVRTKWSATWKLTQSVPLVFAILRLASIRKLEGFPSGETGASVANKRFARLLQYHSQNLFFQKLPLPATIRIYLSKSLDPAASALDLTRFVAWIGYFRFAHNPGEI
jgi:hypothetical protein